jgi:NAD(P)-dependent dehydrogenase (short-subunit alcohol dehydrogenase family)
MGRLKDKVAVITGGASGIGLGTVELFIDEGAFVVVGDLNDDRGLELEEKYKDSISYIHTDVTKEDQVKAMVDRAIERFGRIDCLFNNAGIGGEGADVGDVTVDGFHLTYDVLVLGVMLGMKYAAPLMKVQGSGSIINTASVAGMQSGWASHHYSAAKAAVTHVSRTVAMELAPFNVRVNSICPGGIATSIFASAAGLPTQTAEATLDAVAKGLVGVQPLSRTGVPRDIAEAALYLASDGASFVTGHALVVDGGATLGGAHPSFDDPNGFLGSVFSSLFEALGPDGIPGLQSPERNPDESS